MFPGVGSWRRANRTDTRVRGCRFLVGLSLILVLTACSGNSNILTGTARSPVASEAVKLYTSPPVHYEVIGLVRSESVIGMTQQQDTDRAVANLKTEAAKLGANGVLLTDVNEGGNAIAGTLIGSSGGAAIWAGGVSSKATLTGQAVFVSPE